MEDDHFVRFDLFGESKGVMIGVVDGHGGTKAARYIKNHFAKAFLKLFYAIGDIEKALISTFEQAFIF